MTICLDDLDLVDVDNEVGERDNDISELFATLAIPEPCLTGQKIREVI